MKKKGFTLIELLAVIVILAIIALIAIPQILGVIEKARKGAAEDSAYGYIDTVEKYVVMHDIDKSKYPHDLKDNSWNVADETTKSGTTVPALNSIIEVKGTKPTSGTVTVNNKNKVTGATLVINNYEVVCTEGKCIVGSKSNSGVTPTTNVTPSTPEPEQPSFEEATSGQTYKAIAYLNPKNLSVKCNSGNSQIGTGESNPSGCLKFYVYDDSDNNYKMILDHNIVPTVAWNSNGSNSSIGEAATALASATAGWNGNPRLITANEVAKIAGADVELGWDSQAANTNSFRTLFFLDGTGTNWQTQASDEKGESIYAWLFDYTKGCYAYGCNFEDDSNQGYWTSDSIYYTGNMVWAVSYWGMLDSRTKVDWTDVLGVRPVITLSQSQLNIGN